MYKKETWVIVCRIKSNPIKSNLLKQFKETMVTNTASVARDAYTV